MLINNTKSPYEALKNFIHQDVIRTRQDKEFFKNLTIQEKMLEILLIWSNKSPLSYKQGMNEILACIMYTFYNEKLECTNENIEECNKDPLLKLRYLNNSKYVEADIYSVFDKLMEIGVKELFNSNDTYKTYEERANKRKKEELFQWSSTLNENDINQAISRCKKVVDTYLFLHDYSYYVDFKNAGTEIFLPLLRWMQCLLSREFHICSVLSIWDLILSSSNSKYEISETKLKSDPLHMLDFVCTSMLMLLKKDCNDVNSKLANRR